jgi:nitrogen fixation protein NifM
MTSLSRPEAAADPWLALKLARELFKKTPDTLDAGERRRLAEVARRQTEIERRILSTVEASGVVLPAASVQRTLEGIRASYADAAEYRADLERAGLTDDDLAVAVARDLKVEAVLEQVAGRAPPVTDTDVEIFYLQHAVRFRKPETRTLSHILVTINETLPGSERKAALARIAAIRARLEQEPARFAEQAAKHSECPTAMNGGRLGQMGRGKLYPELDAAAFALAAGAVSDIVESPLGFHVMFCEAIDPARTVPLAEAGAHIRASLEDRRREAFRKAWVASLFAAG